MSMPAGEYYIGDLCYVMTDEEWNEFCSITIDGMKCIDGEFQMKDDADLQPMELHGVMVYITTSTVILIRSMRD